MSKSSDSFLYACTSFGCQVVTFMSGPTCPACHATGEAVRPPIERTDFRERRTALYAVVRDDDTREGDRSSGSPWRDEKQHPTWREEDPDG
jgi:hypothetical protein